MQSFDVFFDLRLNKRLSKQPWGWWFETPSCSLWRQCNGDISVKNRAPVGVRVTSKLHVTWSIWLTGSSGRTVCIHVTVNKLYMMTSSYGNIFCVTGPFWGKVTGTFPSQRPVTQSFDVLFDLRLNHGDAGDLRRHRAHYHVTVRNRWTWYVSSYMITYVCRHICILSFNGNPHTWKKIFIQCGAVITLSIFYRILTKYTP